LNKGDEQRRKTMVEIFSLVALWLCIISLWIRVYLLEKKIIELKSKIDKY